MCVYVSLNIACSDLGVNLLEHPLLRRFVKGFPHGNNHSYCRMLKYRLFGNGFITFPDWCATVIASVRPLIMSFPHCILLTHTWMLQTNKLPNCLHTCRWSILQVHLIRSTWLQLIFLNLMQAIRWYLVFPTWFFFLLGLFLLNKFVWDWICLILRPSRIKLLFYYVFTQKKHNKHYVKKIN